MNDKKFLKMRGIVLTIKGNVVYFDDMNARIHLIRERKQLKTKGKPESGRRYIQNM